MQKFKLNLYRLMAIKSKIYKNIRTNNNGIIYNKRKLIFLLALYFLY